MEKILGDSLKCTCFIHSINIIANSIPTQGHQSREKFWNKKFGRKTTMMCGSSRTSNISATLVGSINIPPK